jgi:hypothetical protein
MFSMPLIPDSFILRVPRRLVCRLPFTLSRAVRRLVTLVLTLMAKQPHDKTPVIGVKADG